MAKLTAELGEDAAAFAARTAREVPTYDSWIKSRAKASFEKHARGAEFSETAGLVDRDGLPKLLTDLRRFGGVALLAATDGGAAEITAEELEHYCPANAKRWLTDFDEAYAKWSAPEQLDRRLAQLPALVPSLEGAFERIAARGSGAIALAGEPPVVAVAESHCIVGKRGLCSKKQLGKLALRAWKPRFLDLSINTTDRGTMATSKITLWNSEKMKKFNRQVNIADVLGVRAAPGDLKNAKPFTLEIEVADDSPETFHTFYVAFEDAEEMDAWQVRFFYVPHRDYISCANPQLTI